MVPGTVQPDGTINRAVPITAASGTTPNAVGTTGTIILEGSNKKEAAWEFLKWWTSKDIQVAFGRELESLMGSALVMPVLTSRQ